MSGRDFGRCVMRIAAGVIVGMVATACWAATPVPDLANIPPNLDAVEGAARQIRSSGCRTSQCQAMVLIADVLRIDLDASAATVGRPRPIPAGRDALASTSLQRALFDHPAPFDAVCDGAARLMARYSLPGSVSDVFVPVSLILLGFEMDQKSEGHCTSRLVRALPDTDAAKTAVANAKRVCVGGHVAASCDEINVPE